MSDLLPSESLDSATAFAVSNVRVTGDGLGGDERLRLCHLLC